MKLPFLQKVEYFQENFKSFNLSFLIVYCGKIFNSSVEYNDVTIKEWATQIKQSHSIWFEKYIYLASCFTF